jgi:hypothetical protein
VGQTASLFGEAELSPHEKKIFALLKANESTHIDDFFWFVLASQNAQ